MKSGEIRSLAICIFSKDGAILAAEGYDPFKGEVFYRPIGGGILFGEYSQQALAREVLEELGVEIAQPRYLGTVENVFTYEGQIGHEIVLVYDAEFVDRSLYDQASLVGYESEDLSFKAKWIPLADFRQGLHVLYPQGLLDLLRQHSYT